MAEQSLKNHLRLDPLYHFFLSPLAIFFVVESIVRIARNPDWDSVVHLLATIFAFVALFKLRVYPLKVQDRVIRLEERLRLKDLLPPAQQSRIPELTESQLIALRFASDAELPDLADKALDAKSSGKHIKQSIRNWRPDHWRV
ncbi:MAG TPA: DUF6526 family protein [Bryobacteraceae bacterium]|jgi:hypothetical protein